MSKRSTTSGISQLELMISLLIMGMIGVALANAFDFNRRLSLTAERFSRKAEQSLIANSVRRMAEEIPLSYGQEQADAFFNGGARAFQFKTLTRDMQFWPGSTTAVSVEWSGDTVQMSAAGQHLDSRAPHSVTSVLAQDVLSVTLSYFGRISGENNRRWHSQWADDVYLPELVKITWQTSSAKPPPPLTLRPGHIERHKYMSLSSLVPPG